MNNHNKKISILKGLLIEYKFLYDKDENKKSGLILDVTKDSNFHYIISILTEDNTVEDVPISLIDYRVFNT